MSKDSLRFYKRIYDPLHGFIRFDEIEKKIIDSHAFQRLRYIHQLGISYLVYPGATHTRFEHSLGVMEIATRIYYRICKSIRPDLFQIVPRKGSLEYLYWKKVLRLAALCHDLGHLPFSHVAERDMFLGCGHEKMTVAVIKRFSSFWKKLQSKPKYNLGRSIEEDVIKIAVGEKKLQNLFSDNSYTLTSWEKILSAIITGDFFGSDRIDYLLRDAQCTGIKYGLFDYVQLIEMLRILPDPQTHELRMGIDERGLESCEALFLSRYFMHKRIYQYASIKAYNFHLRRFMRSVIDQKKIFSVEHFLDITDINILSLLNKATKDSTNSNHFDAQCIMNDKHHFKAIALPSYITKKDLISFKKKNQVEDNKMEWEFEEDIYTNQDFTFPITRRHHIEQAKEVSSLLASLPSIATNWVYISPEYELLFLETLKEN